MKKILLTLAATFCYSLIVNAQTPSKQAPPKRDCGTMEHHEYLKQTRPDYETELNQYNQIIEKYLADKATGLTAGKSSAAIVTVPVVVHVIYRVAGENITDAQAASQVTVLNNDFAKLNADASKVTQATFSTVAAGANIRFCLAQRDPSGNSTTGVTHHTTTVTAFGTDDAVKHASSGGADAWDVTKYINIWVCNLGSTLLGYGEFPTTSLSNTYGLVLHYKYTGSGGTATSPYNLGRTGTHEFGHCFNLLHIWGDDNGACTGSDQCTDTPNQGAEHYGPFTAGSIQTDACTSSGSGVMWMNYMDYTDDGSMYMFTAQQVARMEAVVNTSPWNVLGSSLGCTPVSSLDAGITSIIAPVSGSSVCDNNVTPKITLSNAGSTTITTAKILYKMDALTTQTLNFSGSLATGTSTVLTLNTYTGLSTAAHTFSVSVTAPNGGTDANSANNTMTSTFSVIAAPTGSALPFVERFDAVTFPPTGWVKLAANTLNATNTWARLANTTGIPVVPTTTACAKMDNFSGNTDITGQLDALRTPALSFIGANSSLNVTFDVSHKMFSTTDIDTLNVFISSDCGGTWTRLYSKGGSQLASAVGTQTTAFTPTANAQWRRETVSLASYTGLSSVYLKFESRSGWGNNVYLDNVNVSYTTAAVPVAGFTSTATKCSGSAVTFSDQSTNTPTGWNWSFPGGSVSTATVQNPSITYTASGNYVVTLISSNSSGTSTPVSQTITVNATPIVTVSNATICSGTSTNVIATGATTYSWNTGATTSSITVTPTVTSNYTVVGTNSLSCTNTKTVSVTVNTTPTVVVNSATVCSGNAVNLSATGATTYSWNTGATTSSISLTPTVTTSYIIVGTNSVGCTNTKTVSVTVNTTPTVAVSDATICSGTSANLLATGATTYSWNTGATTSSISVTPTVTTNYTVVGTNSVGCTNTKTVSLTVNATPTVAVNSATVCKGNSVNLSATGAATYSWNTGASTSSISVTPTITSNYTVTGTTAGCVNTKTVSVTIKQLPTVAISNATICSGSTGTLVASGASTYTWNTGATGSNLSVSPTGNTNYTVTGTSTAGCVNTTTASVTVGSAPSIAVNSPSICIGSTATLTASGVSTFTWSTGLNTASISVTPTSTTVYTVTGNLAGCTSSAINMATVTVVSSPTANAGSSQTLTCLSPTINLNGSGVSTYTWSGTGIVSGGNTASPIVNAAGTYTLVGSTAGCSSNPVSVTILSNTTPPAVMSSASGSLNCVNSVVNITASTSVSPVSYAWTGSGITTSTSASTIAVIQGGTFNYTVTNTFNGCSSVGSQAVVQNTTSPTVSVNSLTICSGSNGTLTAGGSTATYSWNTGVTGANLIVSPTSYTNYTVMATGPNGCINTSTASISVSSAPSISVNSATICSGSTATLTATGVTTYTWNTVSNASSISVNPTGTMVYTVTGNLVGCSTQAIQTATVTVNLLPNVTLGTISGPLCVNNGTVPLSGSPSGGIYSGAGVSGSSFDPSISGAGIFTLTYNYTDANTCSASASQTVNVNLCTGLVTLNGADAFSISVYPNPAKDELYVLMDELFIDNASIELYDAIGKLITTEKVVNTTTSITINSLSTGIYTVRVVSGGKQISKRIVKQ
jgi:hypothetical protein